MYFYAMAGAVMVRNQALVGYVTSLPQQRPDLLSNASSNKLFGAQEAYRCAGSHACKCTTYDVFVARLLLLSTAKSVSPSPFAEQSMKRCLDVISHHATDDVKSSTFSYSTFSTAYHKCQSPLSIQALLPLWSAL